jgi:hypothetical protein
MAAGVLAAGLLYTPVECIAWRHAGTEDPIVRGKVTEDDWLPESSRRHVRTLDARFAI